MSARRRSQLLLVLIQISSTFAGLTVTAGDFGSSWSREIARMNVEDEHLSSSNHPSFAWLTPSPTGPEVDLSIRRFSPDGRRNQTCRVRLNNASRGSSVGEISMNDLFSLPNDLEICSLSMKMGWGLKSTWIFVVKMRDCRVNSYEMTYGHEVSDPFFVKRGEDAVDVFYQANGEKKRPCDAEVCRRSYNLSSGVMSEAAPFKLPMLDDGKFEIFSIGSSPNGYYILGKRGDLFSVTLEGSLVSSMKIYDGTFELHPWDCNYSHGYFGHCYVDMNESEKVRCIQTDGKLRVLANATYDFPDIAQDLAMRNTVDGGFYLLVDYCVERCLRYKTHLTRARAIGAGSDVGRLVEFAHDHDAKECDAYLRRSMGFYEDKGEICLIDRCYVVPEDYHSLDRHYVNVKCL